nr:TetR family transcriptional regulator [Phytomonospora endophytica]
MPSGFPKPRKTPVQERSAERVTAMLDVCGELLDEIGYRALTTTLIAERARVPIGSVYQFFADKHELADSLAARHLGDLLDRIDDPFDPERLSYPADCSHEALPGQPPDDWWQLFSTFYDELVTSYRTEPGCRVLSLGTDSTLWSPGTRPHPHDVIIDHLTAYFEKYPHLTEIPEWTRLGARWGVEILHALVAAAFRADPDGDTGVLSDGRVHARHILTGYFTVRRAGHR